MRIIRHIRPALGLTLVATVLLGIGYPLFITAVAQIAFPEKATGSLMTRDGIVVGSKLLGQNFTSPKYFWGRIATGEVAYNALASAGANLSPTNPSLVERARARQAALLAVQSNSTALAPQDLLTSSASGLDPHISVAAAHYQAPRVAKARGLKLEEVEALITERIRHPMWDFIGQERVNVLRLNLALDEKK